MWLRLDEVQREVERARGHYLVSIRPQTLLPTESLTLPIRVFLAEHLRARDVSTRPEPFTLRFEAPGFDPPVAIVLDFVPDDSDEDFMRVAWKSTAVHGIAPYERIFDALIEKASRYGRTQLPPYLIVLWADRTTALDDHFIDLALFDTSSRMRGGHSGFFTRLRDGRPAYRHVSAVAFYHCWVSEAGHEHLLRVFHNPFADQPLPVELFADYPQYIWERTGSGTVAAEWQQPNPDLEDEWTVRMTGALQANVPPVEDADTTKRFDVG